MITMEISIVLFIPFPWRKTFLITRQLKIQKGKSTLILLTIKERMPTLAGIEHISVDFLLHGLRFFHLSTQKVRVQSVRN